MSQRPMSGLIGYLVLVIALEHVALQVIRYLQQQPKKEGAA